MRRPAFQFYTGDWSQNSNLRRCTFEEKGVWVDVLCLMHDQPEYGVLRWPLAEIAEAIKCDISALKAIHRKGVLKGSDTALVEPFIYTPRSGRKDGAPVVLLKEQAGPIWYSSRMVRDEYIRAHRGESSRFVSEHEDPSLPSPNQTPKAAPKPPFGDGSSSSSSSSSSSKRERAPKVRSIGEARKTRKTTIPDDFDLTPERQAYAEKHLPSVDAVALMETFRSMSKSKGWEYADWNQHWQTLVRQWAPNSGHWSSGQFPRKSRSTELRQPNGTEVRW